MKALKDVVLKVNLQKPPLSRVAFWNTIIGEEDPNITISAGCFKSIRSAKKNLEDFMKLNGFKYEVVE